MRGKSLRLFFKGGRVEKEEEKKSIGRASSIVPDVI